MKLLHIADLHLGKSLNNYSFEEDQRYILDRIVSQVQSLAPDAVLIAGDIYDKANPSGVVVEMVDRFLGQLADTKIPIFICAGNHDSKERIAYASGLLAREGIYISPALGPKSHPGRVQEVSHFTLDFPDGPATFWLFPFVVPENVRAALDMPELDSYTDALQALVDTCDIDPACRNIALAHQFVSAAGLQQTRYDSEKVGTLDNVDVHVFDAFDYVALGHLHGAHNVGSPRVRYSGSPLKYSLSEASNDKSLTVVELGPKQGTHLCPIEISEIALEPLRDLREMRGSLEELLSAEAQQAGNPADYIFFTLTDDNLPQDTVAQLKQVYPHFMDMKVDNSATRARQMAGASGVAMDEGKTLEEHFADFFADQTGQELSEEQRKIVHDLAGSEVV